MQNVNKLIEAATKATNEEGVKVAWIKYGGFVGHITEKVDLFVPPAVLFEFKFHANLTSAWHKSLAQALIYVHRIHAGQSSLPMPSHVALVDNTAALLFPLEEQLLEIVNGDHSWDYAASIPDKKLLAAVKALGAVPRETYDATDPRQVTEFLSLLDTLPTSSRKKIVSAHNFDAVYSAWCRDIGSCIEVTDTDSLGPYFVADLREDAYFNAKRGMLAFTFNGSEHQVPARTYEAFWSLYGRPPATDVQSLILSRLHMFAPKKKRQMDGAFYTPQWIARKGVDYLDKAFPGWQDDVNTYVWDPCCGSGNLEEPLRNFDRLFMSTLDIAEIGLLKNLNLFPGATLFPFNFLNGSYSSLPEELRAIIEDETKRLIILMNPPYGEATASVGGGANKTGVSLTRCKKEMAEDDLGKAGNELFNQFLYRVNKWCPRASVGVFAKLKYVSAPGSAEFRDAVWNYESVGGFLIPGDTFPGVVGDFPISFIVWEPGERQQALDLDVFDGKQVQQQRKTISDCRDYMNDWFKRPKCDTPAIPLKSALTVDAGDAPMLSQKPLDAFGYAGLNSNDPLNNNVVFFISEVSSRGHGCAIAPDTFEQALVQVAVRKLVAPTWLNDRDQFQVPTCDRATYKNNQAPGTTNLPKQFIVDAIIFALFHGCNNTSTLRGVYKGKDFTLDNQFFPYPTSDVVAWTANDLGLNRQAARAQNTFVFEYLAKNIQFASQKALQVLVTGKEVYRKFYQELPNLQRVKYSLQSWNPGWYQVRMALKDAGTAAIETERFAFAFNALKEQLEPGVYELGFLAR